MIASVLLAVVGITLLALIGLWLYVSFGVEQWSERNRKNRRDR